MSALQRCNITEISLKALFTIPARNLSSELCHDVDSCLGGGAEALDTKGKEFPVQPLSAGHVTGFLYLLSVPT